MAEKEKESQYQKVPTKELICDEILEVPAYGYGIRHVQGILLLFCLTVAYSTRAQLGVTVVAMTKHSSKHNATFYNDTNSILNETSIFDFNASNTYMVDNKTSTNFFDINETVTRLDDDLETPDSSWNVYRKYDWPKPKQEMILDAFFLGYFLMMLPMAWICQRYGGKIPLQISCLFNGVISLVTPTVAVWGGWVAVCCCRVLQGMTQAGMFPSTHTVLSKWVPISERATFSSYIYTGSTIGTVIGFQTAGALAGSAAGWPATFWVFGIIGIAAFFLMALFAAASPRDHKTISDEEKNFILGRIDDGVKKRLKTPWGQILRSKPVWGTVFTHGASGMCFVFLFTQIPTYMHYILGFNIKNSGLLSSLPYIASFFFSVGYGIISDYCTNRGYISLKTARVASNTLGLPTDNTFFMLLYLSVTIVDDAYLIIAQVVPALCLVAVSFTDNSTIAVILLILGVGLYSGVHTGWMVNYIDLSPNFSGSLMAFGNTGAAFCTLSQPFLISNIVTDVKNRSQWRIMMFLMASIIVICNTVFVWFMSADTQPWDNVESEESRNGEEKKK